MIAIERPVRASASAANDADETWEIEDDRGVAARCALWYREPRLFDGRRAGFIGSYFARDAEAGAAILARAFERLRANGCVLAVGPIDGSTWRPYRFTTWSNGAPPFLLEPANPAAYVEHFERAEFSAIARYVSTFDDRLASANPAVARAQRRLRSHGVTVRRFSSDAAERHLRAIYDLSRTAFANNVLQTPIAFEAFAAIYRPLLERVDPAFVLIAEREGTPCGFVFALADRAFDPAGPVLIVKTLARDPDPTFAGLGAVLAERVRHAAAAAGYRGSISALIHEENASFTIADAYGGHPIRRYAVYARQIA